jgi:hypothetical protein
MGRLDSLHGLAPSQGMLPVTHWSQACLEVVARHAATPPLRRWFGAVVTGGFSDAWHLLIWRESRSLCAPSLISDEAHVDGRRRALTCARTGRRSADTCRADRPCLDRAGEQAHEAEIKRSGRRAGEGSRAASLHRCGGESAPPSPRGAGPGRKTHGSACGARRVAGG